MMRQFTFILTLFTAVLFWGCEPSVREKSNVTNNNEKQIQGAINMKKEEIEKKLQSGKLKKATFGAGCFWGVEATFRKVKGVVHTAVGFMGGNVENPSYKEVCYNNTGHAEVVQVIYDPEKVSYEELLDIFWKNHDPTQKNRQGPDIGDQYRSVIFYHSPEQEEAARKSKQKQDESDRFKKPIATEISPASEFWRAEEYHQQYLEKRGLATCHM